MTREVNWSKVKEACKDMDRIRKTTKNIGGKTGEELIREWRDKRR